MTRPEPGSFARYLAAKATVDDRALNAHVWRCLAERLRRGDACRVAGDGVAAAPPSPVTCHLSPVTAPQALRVLEVGAGIGTMIDRLIRRGLLTDAEYVAVDADPSAAAAARAWLAEPRGRPYGVTPAGTDGALMRGHARGRIEVTWISAAVQEAVCWPDWRDRFDLLLAHHFLDLVDVPGLLPELIRCLAPAGLAYLTLNFDGLTVFEPPLDPALDERIVALYHATMDARTDGGRSGGDSRTGRRLMHQLRQSGAAVLAAGASDWVVHADPDLGAYAADEAYFLHALIETVRGALADHPDLDPAAFAAWIEARHAQIERGELIYVAHQLDVLARRL